jgi:Cytochrome c oxidase subunit IV
MMSEQQPEQAKELEKHEVEWIRGEQLELIRIPPPTVWPVTLALGITGMAFGVVTQWILSAAGLFLFLLGAAGWIEDLKKDVL